MSQAMISQSLYGGRVIIGRDRYHRYVVEKNDITHKTGLVGVSVTSLLKILDKTALRQWYANQSVEYLRDQYRAKKGKLEEADFEAAKQAANNFANGARVTGGNVDDAISAYIRAQLEGAKWTRPAMSPAETNAFLAFQKWAIHEHIQFTASQRILYHPELNVAGCLDVAYRKHGQDYRGDFKATDLTKHGTDQDGNPVIFMEWGLQIGMYTTLEQAEVAVTAMHDQGEAAGIAAGEAFSPKMTILKLDKIHGGFQEAEVPYHHSVAGACMLYLNGVYHNEIYQDNLKKQREKWGSK